MYEAYARNTDPTTSHDAAESIARKLPKLEGLVLSVIGILGAATQTEVADWLEGNRPGEINSPVIWSISPRFRPLEKKGLICKTGERRDRKNVYRIDTRQPRQTELWK